MLSSVFVVWALLLPAAAEGEACRATPECTAGLQCQRNTCVIVGSGDSCRADADCVSGLLCIRGACVSRSQLAPVGTPAATPAAPRNPVKPGRPYERPYLEGEELPEGAVITERSNRKMWGSGIGVLSASWLTVASTTAALCKASGCMPWVVPVSFIPVVGPLAAAAVAETGPMTFYLIAAATQLTGVGLIVGGILAKKQFVVIPVAQVTVSGGSSFGLHAAGEF